jgi:transcriptional regulator with XRE-family HTH domain
MTTKKKASDASRFLKKLVGELTLAKLLISIRHGEEMSQVEFAKSLKISRQYLCDVEHGKRFVSPKSAAEWANKLGYSPTQFVRLCLQDLINRNGLKLKIDVKTAA